MSAVSEDIIEHVVDFFVCGDIVAVFVIIGIFSTAGVVTARCFGTGIIGAGIFSTIRGAAGVLVFAEDIIEHIADLIVCGDVVIDSIRPMRPDQHRIPCR